MRGREGRSSTEPQAHTEASSKHENSCLAFFRS